MEYARKSPTYTAMQWDGTNTEDILAQADAWFACWPGDHATHDAEAELITICTGNQLAVGDWLVSAGTWGPGLALEGYPEVVQDALFQLKYAPQA